VIRVAIVTVSDKASRGERADAGGPAIRETLEANGVAVAAVTVARPSLDDVYLRYAGRSFSQAEEKEEVRV